MKKMGGLDFEKAAFWRKAALGGLLLFLIFLGLVWGLTGALKGQLAALGGLNGEGTLRAALATGTAGGVFGLREILFLLATICVTTTLRMHRYVVFGRALGLDVPVRVMYLTFLAGMALLPTPGKMGVALRLYLLKRRYGIPYRKSGPMLVMDLVTDSLAMLLLVALALGFAGGVAGLGVGALMMAGLMSGMMALLFWPALLRRAVKTLYLMLGKRKPRLFAGLLRMMRVVRKLFGPKVLLGTLGLSFCSWVILVGTLAHVWSAAPLAFHTWALAICGGVVAGMASLMPGGMGGSEAGMVGIFAALDVPVAQAVVLALVARVLMFWIPVVVGWLVLPFALRD